MRYAASTISVLLKRGTGFLIGRTAFATALGALLILGFGLGTGVAAASDSRSFTGCPLLLESKSSGPCVEKLQNELNAVNSAYKLTVTRNFDAPTRIAVLDFQGRNHLGADGNVGSVTADELQKQFDALSANKPQPPAQPQAPTPVNHGKVSVESGGSTYYSHAATVEMDKQFSSLDSSKQTCDLIKAVVKIKAVADVACWSLKAGSFNVAHIVHHAATTNGCARFQHFRYLGGMGPVYADHSATCRSMD